MTAQHIERSSESYVIEIRGKDKVESLLNREFEGNYVNMAMHLKIMNRRMVLLNPKFMTRKREEGGETSHMAPPVDTSQGAVIVDITTKSAEKQHHQSTSVDRAQ
jgi:hypothetical protein